MLNNLTNFFNLIAGRKIKTSTTIVDTDLITLGTRDPNYIGGYQPTAISYGEFVNSLSGAGVQSVTGLDTDNTNPLYPIVKISVDGTTITGDGTPASPLIATVPTPSYKVYSALLTQTGTAAPVVTVVTNTLGTVTIARVNPGRYSVTTSGLFTLNKTIISINTITTSAGPYGGYTGISDSGSTNVFYIDTAKVIGGGTIPGVGADNVLFRTPLEIKVYN